MAWSLITANNPSSIKKGAARAAANGHPRIPPSANHQMPCAVLSPPLQFMNAAAPRSDVYMAKLDGRYAVLAWKFPGDRTVASRKKIPILGFRVKLMTRKKRTWHRAHTNAKMYRTK